MDEDKDESILPQPGCAYQNKLQPDYDTKAHDCDHMMEDINRITENQALFDTRSGNSAQDASGLQEFENSLTLCQDKMRFLSYAENYNENDNSNQFENVYGVTIEEALSEAPGRAGQSIQAQGDKFPLNFNSMDVPHQTVSEPDDNDRGLRSSDIGSASPPRSLTLSEDESVEIPPDSRVSVK